MKTLRTENRLKQSEYLTYGTFARWSGKQLQMNANVAVCLVDV